MSSWLICCRMRYHRSAGSRPKSPCSMHTSLASCMILACCMSGPHSEGKARQRSGDNGCPVVLTVVARDVVVPAERLFQVLAARGVRFEAILCAGHVVIACWYQFVATSSLEYSCRPRLSHTLRPKISSCRSVSGSSLGHSVDLQQPLNEVLLPALAASPSMPPSAYLAAVVLVLLGTWTQVQNSHIVCRLRAMANSVGVLSCHTKATCHMCNWQPS